MSKAIIPTLHRKIWSQSVQHGTTLLQVKPETISAIIIINAIFPSDGKGNWSTSHCKRTTYNSSTVTCQCNRLGIFGSLLVSIR